MIISITTYYILGVMQKSYLLYTAFLRVMSCQYADDVEEDDVPRPRVRRAGKKKSAKKPITQV